MFNFDFGTPTDEVSPQEAHDRWEAATNMTAGELRGLRGDPFHGAYLEAASGKRQTSDPPIPGGPLDDAIHLAETPRSAWGADEREEAAEALAFGARHTEQFSPDEGTDLLPDREPRVHKREVALARWGFDMKDDSWP